MEINEIEVGLKDHSTLVLRCDRGIAMTLNEQFAFEVPNHQFSPKFKSGIWDGKSHLFSEMTHQLPAGLFIELTKIAKEMDYAVTRVETEYGLPGPFQNIFNEFEFNQLVEALGLPFELYQEQKDALEFIITHKRGVVVSPTGSGKSLIAYIMSQYLQCLDEFSQKILIVAPTVPLVDQMANDFIEYGCDPDLVHKIYQGQSHKTDKPIIISTWQSIYQNPTRWFLQFGAVIGDECHGFKDVEIAKSLNRMMNKCKNAEWRLGMTGSTDGVELNMMALRGMFGPIKRVATTKQMQDDGKLADLRINVVNTKYSKEMRTKLWKKFAHLKHIFGDEHAKRKYKAEVDLICGYEPRNRLVIDLASNLKGNTLVLFRYRKHGQALEKLARQTDRPVFYIDGTVKNREDIRQQIIACDNALIIGSLGTYSTGINIPNLCNVILASPHKHKIKVLQLIGRSIRKYADKVATLVDIRDDIRYNANKTNYAWKHGGARLKVYKKEGWKWKRHNVQI